MAAIFIDELTIHIKWESMFLPTVTVIYAFCRNLGTQLVVLFLGCFHVANLRTEAGRNPIVVCRKVVPSVLLFETVPAVVERPYQARPPLASPARFSARPS